MEFYQVSSGRKATLFALTTVLLWSTVATAFKLALEHLSPVELLLVAASVSTTILGGIVVAQGKAYLVLKGTRRDWLLSMGLGSLNPFLYYLILFQAYELLPAQQAQPINYSWSIMLAVLSVPLLKQTITRNQWAAMILGYAGVLVISTQGNVFALNFTNGWGVALALLSTVIWALYWIYNTKDTRDPVVALFINFVFSLPLIGAYYVVVEGPRGLPMEGILWAAYVGGFEMGLCFVLWLYAMKLTPNTAQISSLIFLSPFLSLILIHLVLGEDIHISTFVGLILIVVGLVCQNYRMSVSRRGIRFSAVSNS